MTRQRFDLKATAGISAALVVLALFVGVLANNWALDLGTAARIEAAEPQAFVAAGETAAYVKFEGVAGEAQDKNHRDWINLLSFSQGQSAPSALAVGGGGRAGRVVFDDLVLTKELDKSSPKLAEAVCTGENFPTVTIHVTGALFGPQIYYACELKNVSVTSYRIVSPGTGTFPTEELSLNFTEIKVSYTPYDETGREQSNVDYGWNLEEARRL